MGLTASQRSLSLQVLCLAHYGKRLKSFALQGLASVEPDQTSAARTDSCPGLQILLEGTGRDPDRQGQCQRERQEDPRWVQADR